MDITTSTDYAWQGAHAPLPAYELTIAERSGSHLQPWQEVLWLPARGAGFVGVGARWTQGLTERLYASESIGAGVGFGAYETRQFGSLGVFALRGALGARISERLSLEVFAEHWSNGSILRIYKAWPDVGLDAVGVGLRVRY